MIDFGWAALGPPQRFPVLFFRPETTNRMETTVEKNERPDGRQTADRANLLERIGLFVLDMDGTFYLGDQVIEGAIDFVRYVERQGRKVLFFTNNSSQSPRVYMDRLARMGCPITREQIMTSGDVTITYLKENYEGKRVYLVGTDALTESFREEGICLWKEGDPRPDLVVDRKSVV